MKHTPASRRIRTKPASRRLRRLTIVGLAALSFAIATVDTAAAASDFVLDNNTTAASHEPAGH